MIHTTDWTCTDPDTNQYGRQLSDFLFEFKQEGTEVTGIDLNAYTNGEIDKCIRSFGYTLHKTEKGVTNIRELYPDSYNWIIAECLFETYYC